MNTQIFRQDSHSIIDHIFKELLPAQGMAERPAQIALSHAMLDAMLEGKIALCDAGTGIGKTYAYLVAGTVFHRAQAIGGRSYHPILISTSSIALQNAIEREYLPFLSAILMEDGIIDDPLQAVIRKGKGHYVCDSRLERRLGRLNLQKKNTKAAEALLSLRDCLDMDEAVHLSGYDQARVCVPAVCTCREDCRYLRFLDTCDSGRYQFQICNHNLLLADAIHRSCGRRPILPEHAVLVMDEAHKLSDVARQMFGVTLTATDIRTLIAALKLERFILAAETLEEAAGPLLHEMAGPWEEGRPLEEFLRLLVLPNRILSVIRRQLHRMMTADTHRKLESLAATVSLFCAGNPGLIFYTEEDAQGGTILCAAPLGLSGQLRATLWNQTIPMVLTSGTLAVGRDFRRFKEETGLLTDGRVTESVSLSPFDYRRNCLLYLPQLPPQKQAGGDLEYYSDLADEIAGLLRASHGHALVLFTSYAAMSAVKALLTEMGLPFPLFTMGRNAAHATALFKKHPGSVLLATGAAWEGFDFPGDCVSLLVIPRLPFAYPDARKEKERENYPSLQSFIRAAVVPEMQIKLKQGFGRAIRTETDTCVVAILDERAARGRRYHGDVRDALPEMDTTSSLGTVEQFLHSAKRPDYFTEGAA